MAPSTVFQVVLLVFGFSYVVGVCNPNKMQQCATNYLDLLRRHPTDERRICDGGYSLNRCMIREGSTCQVDYSEYRSKYSQLVHLCHNLGYYDRRQYVGVYTGGHVPATRLTTRRPFEYPSSRSQTRTQVHMSVPIGVSVAVAVIIVALIIAVYCCCRAKQRVITQKPVPGKPAQGTAVAIAVTSGGTPVPHTVSVPHSHMIQEKSHVSYAQFA